jgi:hypothetical protein
MGVSGDGVQQFVDRLVDEDHNALSTVDLLETTSSRPRSALSRDRPDGGAADGRPLRRVSDRSTEPAPVWAPRVRGSDGSETEVGCASAAARADGGFMVRAVV